jgi:ABC-type multidrug transport system fused ATPase/permease subunit
MVSQRVKTLQAADQILLLDKGQQAGLGSHEELLESLALYRQLFASQDGQEVPHA